MLMPSQHKAQWFTKSAAFDEELRQRFGTAVEAALGGALQHWATQGPQQQLALGDPGAGPVRRAHPPQHPMSFAGDAQASTLALQAIDAGNYTRLLPEVARLLYLPLEHAEDPAMQQRSVAAFEALLESATDAGLREDLPERRLRPSPSGGDRALLPLPAPQPHSGPLQHGRGVLMYLAQPGSGF